jgi:anti-sigma factor RsiW
VNCEEVLSQLSDYLDDEVREELCRAIEAHLHACHDCQVEVDTIKKTILLYRSERPSEVPVSVSGRLQAALAKAYEEPGAAGGENPSR